MPDAVVVTRFSHKVPIGPRLICVLGLTVAGIDLPLICSPTNCEPCSSVVILPLLSTRCACALMAVAEIIPPSSERLCTVDPVVPSSLVDVLLPLTVETTPAVLIA